MYKIGTRGSLLAVTQSTLLKQELERLSGESFELVTIKTQGDQVVDRPLWQLEGKDFFTKELDEALLSGQVDLVVHSYKDLGSVRPAGIELAAITRRDFAHDVLLIHKDTVHRLPHWEGDFIVGTSSPRRITNLTRDLGQFLPYTPTVRCETLRGNINSRIQKLRDGKYHAIVLALAGLERLAQLPSSHTELEHLLSGLSFTVLPLSLFPSAAAQGALAVEIASNRRDSTALREIIRHVHHQPTSQEISRERSAFQAYGGGCHLAVGIHVRWLNGDYLHFHRGQVDGKEIRIKKREGAAPSPTHAKNVFLGQSSAPGVITDRWFRKEATAVPAPVQSKHVFVTTSHVLPSLKGEAKTLWSAGPVTHRKLVSQGHWVHGGAEGLGHQEIMSLRSSKALQLMMGEASWLVLTHEHATSALGETFAGYRTSMQPMSHEERVLLSQVSHAWWSSFPQFEAYASLVPELKMAQHFCGLGKTFLSFQAAGIAVTPLTDHQEFLNLVGAHEL